MGQGREGFDLNERGLQAAARGDHAAANRLYQQAIEVWRGMGPDYRAHLGVTEYNLAQSLCAQGRRGEALPILENAVQLLRETVGVRNLNTLTTMNYLASLSLMRGNTAQAEALFREALAVERELYPKNVQLALSLGGLSSILVREDKAVEALPLAEESLSIALATEGEDSLHTALAYANVATVHKWERKYDRALPLYRKSLSIYERLLGPDHPRAAGVLTEIGLIEMQDGNYTLAERDMQHSLNIVERAGLDFEQWIGESNLGMLRYRQGKYDEAARLLAHSLSMQEEAGIHTGRDMAITLDTLAKVRERQRRFEDAKELRERAVTISSYR